jgi:predicted DNA-binding mobile mystery protein A
MKMKNRLLDIGRKQLDQKLKHLLPLIDNPAPKNGWLRAIRTSLGLPAVLLAERLGMKPASLSELEHSEASGTVTLNSLRKVAAAMDCELVYAIVPRTSLDEILNRKAGEKARSILGRVGHSMRLEDQGVNARQAHEQVQSLTKTLLENPKALWK